MYQISDKGVALVAKWEGFEEEAYLDGGGVPTIGYGSTRYFDLPGSPKVKMGDRIDEPRARQLLLYTLENFWDQVENSIDVPLEQNQVDALACFIYNVGVTAFLGSTMLRLLNRGDYAGAHAQFKRWNRDNGKVIAGLVNRRREEAILFGGFEA